MPDKAPLTSCHCGLLLQAYAEREAELIFNESILLQTIGKFLVVSHHCVNYFSFLLLLFLYIKAVGSTLCPQKNQSQIIFSIISFRTGEML